MRLAIGAVNKWEVSELPTDEYRSDAKKFARVWKSSA